MKKFICQICGLEFEKTRNDVICYLCSDIILEYLTYMKFFINNLIRRELEHKLNKKKDYLKMRIRDIYRKCKIYYQFRISFKI